MNQPNHTPGPTKAHLFTPDGLRRAAQAMDSAISTTFNGVMYGGRHVEAEMPFSSVNRFIQILDIKDEAAECGHVATRANWEFELTNRGVLTIKLDFDKETGQATAETYLQAVLSIVSDSGTFITHSLGNLTGPSVALVADLLQRFGHDYKPPSSPNIIPKQMKPFVDELRNSYDLNAQNDVTRMLSKFGSHPHAVLYTLYQRAFNAVQTNTFLNEKATEVFKFPIITSSGRVVRDDAQAVTVEYHFGAKDIGGIFLEVYTIDGHSAGGMVREMTRVFSVIIDHNTGEQEINQNLAHITPESTSQILTCLGNFSGLLLQHDAEREPERTEVERRYFVLHKSISNMVTWLHMNRVVVTVVQNH